MSNADRLATLAKRTLARESQGYLRKDVDVLATVEELKQHYGLDKVYRFDVGKNTDGYSPLIDDVFNLPELIGLITGSLLEYPDNSYRLLRNQLARLHDLPPEWFTLGAGLESVIDQICRAVIDPGNRALIPVPNFDVFESSSIKAGAVLEYLTLPAPEYRWSAATVDELISRMCGEGPGAEAKVVWISNPVNPTGQHIPHDSISRIVNAAAKSRTFVVVDEAYGEYTDNTGGVVSATSMVAQNPHLMVLRTFSKAYCLPSTRVGYMACASPEVRAAVNVFRPMFPFSWISLYIAQLAILDQEHIEDVRTRLAARKAHIYEQLQAPDSRLEAFEYVASDTNTIMFRHASLTAEELHEALARRGFLTANLDRFSGIQGERFLRMTVHNDATNKLFLQACREVASEVEHL